MSLISGENQITWTIGPWMPYDQLTMSFFLLKETKIMIDEIIIIMNEDLPKRSSEFDFCFASGAKSDNGATAK